MHNKKKILLISGLLFIAAAGIFVYLLAYYGSKSVSTANSTQSSGNNNANVDRIASYEFAGGEFILTVEQSAAGQQLLFENRTTGVAEKIGTNTIVGIGDVEHQYLSFFWNPDHTRLYFISIIPEWEHIAFQYLDITDPDPYAITEIPYEDPDTVLNADVQLSRVDDRRLYMMIDGQTYALDYAQGGGAILKVTE